MGIFFGILVIIQGLFFMVISFSPRGKENVSPLINFIIGLVLLGAGSAMMG